ncbi:MAG: hypothetical protein KDD82_04235 [Planctomycetes bacterium]|nr:hypothetical protein [Planctomycetota bacterium]
MAISSAGFIRREPLERAGRLAGLERVELLGRAPRPEQLAWLRGLLAHPPAASRIVAEDAARAHAVAAELDWAHAEALAGVAAPEALASFSPTLRVVLCERAREPLARWALRRAEGAVLVVCGAPPPGEGPLRFELRAPGELASLLPWLQAFAPRAVDLAVCPRLLSDNQLSALRELKELEGELERAAAELRLRGVPAQRRATRRLQPASLTVHLRPPRGLRGWLADDDGSRLSHEVAPLLRVPPSQA